MLNPIAPIRSTDNGLTARLRRLSEGISFHGSLRSRILLLLLAAIFPVFCVYITKAIFATEAAIERATNSLQLEASLIAAQHNQVVETARQVLTAISSVQSVREGEDQRCSQYLAQLQQRYDSYTSFGVIGLDGYARCRDAPTPTPTYLGDRSYFQEAITRKGFVSSEHILGRVTGKHAIAFALPAVDAAGQVTQVVFAGIDLARLAASVNKAHLVPGTRVVVLDRAGVVLLSHPEIAGAIGKKMPVPVVQEALSGRFAGVREGLDAAGQQRIFAFQPSSLEGNAPFYVYTSVLRSDVVASARRELNLELALLALVAFLGGFIAWALSGRMIVKPASQILLATQRVQGGLLDTRIPIKALNSGSEFTQIAEGFNRMADALVQRQADLETELTKSRETQERLLSAQRLGRIGHTELDLITQRIYWSDEVQKLFGIVPGEFDGTFATFIQRIHPDDRALFLQKRDDAMRDHVEFDIEYRVITAAGDLRWIHQIGNELRDAAGTPIRRTGVMQDITERKLSTLALQNASELLRRTGELAKIGGWEVQVPSMQRFWSDQVYQIYELDSGSVPSIADTLKFYAPEARDKILAALKAGAEQGSPWDMELPMITAKGRPFWGHNQGQALMQDGKVIRLVGTLQDITDRKRTELAFAKASDLLRRTGDIARIGGWEFFVEERRLVWSEQLYRLYEISTGDFPSMEEAIDLYAPAARPAIKAAIEAAIHTGTSWDMELPMVSAVGRSLWARSQGQARLHKGKVVRLVGTLQDITEKHASQAHLRLLEAAISRLNDVILITEVDPIDEPGPRIVYVNDAFERNTGYSREEALGQSPRFLQGPKTQHKQLERIKAAMKKWEPVRSELINYKKNGEEFWQELDIVPIADASGWYTHWVAVQRDVTRRKHIEQAMLESEQRYTALFESAPVPMWVFDENTWRFMAVNDVAIKTYGWSSQELMTMGPLDMHPVADHDRVRQRLVESAALRKGVWTHVRKDGSMFPVEVVSKAIQYGGKPSRFVVGLDLTSQRQAENNVQEHLFTLQRAADASQAITWHRTLDGMTQEVAEQARGVIGAHQAYVSLSPADGETSAATALSVSQSHEALWGMDEKYDFRILFASMLNNNRPRRLTGQALQAIMPRVVAGEASLARHKLPPMSGCLVVPLLGRDGKNIGLLQLSDKYEGEFTQQDEYVAMELARLAAAAMENTRLLETVNELNTHLEQKVAERTEALTRQEALFRALAQQAPQVVWTVNPAGEVTYLNRAWFDLMGGAMEDWAGTKWLDAIHPDDVLDVLDNWKRSVAGNVPFSGTRRLIAKDRSLHTMSYRGSPVFDEQGALSFWVGIDADITEIKSIEAELRLSNQELEAFSYSVSHDLRSPLNTIDGFSRLLSKQLNAQSGEKAAHYLARIHAGVGQMGQLIEDILSLAQVSRVQLRHEPIDLSAMVAECIEALRVRDPERVVNVTIQGRLQAFGDSRLIRVVFENLLGNAWKFSSLQDKAEIVIGQTLDPAAQTTYFVRDNGAGFDMAYADKLFRAFQRLHTTSEFPGTGIGLATVNRIIARHGGQLWTESAVGKGATFFFTLPKFPTPL